MALDAVTNPGFRRLTEAEQIDQSSSMARQLEWHRPTGPVAVSSTQPVQEYQAMFTTPRVQPL
jgi:hypothetical protein